MRKFALLFAFVLVLACAGGAFATDYTTAKVVDIKPVTGRGSAVIAGIRGIGNNEKIVINRNTVGNLDDQLDAADFQWIYEVLTSSDPTYGSVTIDIAGGDKFTLDLNDSGSGNYTYQKTIPAGSFKGYRGMKELVAAANTITSVGANAFEDTEGIAATGLDSIFTNTALESIGADAFKDSEYGADVVAGGVAFKTLGTGAFAGSKILSFTVTSQLCTAIPDEAFSECSALSKVVMTNSGVKTIGAKAFYKCPELLTADLANETTAIGDEAFFGCVRFKGEGDSSGEMIKSGSKLATIGAKAFENCKAAAFTALKLTNAKKLTEIGDYAFRGCTELTDLTDLKETKLTKIGVKAFADTAVGAGLEFPTTLKNVGKGAFDYYLAFQVSVTPTVIFRSGTDEPADRKITDAAGVRAFLESLDMTGAFGETDSDQWPLTAVDRNTIKIDYNRTSGSADSLCDILNVATGAGGIVDDPSNDDTKAIVGLLRGMGFRPIHIVAMLTNINNKPALSENTVAQIFAITPPVVEVYYKKQLGELITHAENVLATPIGTAKGELAPEKAAAAQQKLDEAITTARNTWSGLADGAVATDDWKLLQKAIDDFTDVLNKTGPDQSQKTKAKLDILIKEARDLLETKIGAAKGQLPQDKAADALADLLAAITRADTRSAGLQPSDDATTLYDELALAISKFNKNLNETDPSGGGNPSKSGGGCAAGFAPIAALFVLGAALKLRKGR